MAYKNSGCLHMSSIHQIHSWQNFENATTMLNICFYRKVRLLSGFCYLTMFTIFQTAAKNQNKNICVEFTECNSNKHIMVCAMKKDNLIKIWYLGCWQHILVHTFGFFAFCLNSWGKKIKCISESGSERATSVCIWMRMPWKRPQTI